MTKPKEEPSASKLVKSRSILKRKVTIALKSVEQNVIESAFKSAEITILPLLREIKQHDSDLLKCLDNAEVDELSEEFLKELDQATTYHLEVNAKLTEYRKMFCTSGNPVSSPVATNELKLPNLKCSLFSGEDADSLKFHDFLTQF